MSGARHTRRGVYPPIQPQAPRRRNASQLPSASQPNDSYYEEQAPEPYEEEYKPMTYDEELRKALVDLHEDCRKYLWNNIGVDPDTHGNYLDLAVNIVRNGFNAYNLQLTHEQAITYRSSRLFQDDILAMAQQYQHFPEYIVNEFQPRPRNPPAQPKPRASVASSRNIYDNVDDQTHLQQTSMLLNQQSRLTDMHAYQASASVPEQAFGPFQVDEAVPVPWPASSPMVATSRENVAPPETPRRTTPVVESYTPCTIRMPMTPSMLQPFESPLTPGFGNMTPSSQRPRARLSMETPGSG
jgi:hypothetical protein